MKFAEWAKAYAALVGSVVTALLAAPVPLPDAWRPWLVVAAVVATVVATWAIPNRPAELPAPAWKSAGPAWDPQDGTYADLPEFDGEYRDDYFDKYYTG